MPLLLVHLRALLVDEQERDEHDGRADPVEPA